MSGAGPRDAAARTDAVATSAKHGRYGLSSSSVALVMIGGGAGVLSRYGVGQSVPSPLGWPLVTLLINLLGAWALGVLLEGLQRRGPDEGLRRALRLLLGTGFLGGFTTYSALALDSVLLLANDAGAALYLVLSLFGGVVASWSGIWCGAANGRRSLARRAAPDEANPGKVALPKEDEP